MVDQTVELPTLKDKQCRKFCTLLKYSDLTYTLERERERDAKQIGALNLRCNKSDLAAICRRGAISRSRRVSSGGVSSYTYVLAGPKYSARKKGAVFTLLNCVDLWARNCVNHARTRLNAARGGIHAIP